MEQKPQFVFGETAFYALIWVVLLLIGVDFFKAYLAFVTEPYQDVYSTWVEPFFTGRGQPYLQAALLFLAIGAVLRPFRLSIWIAKVIIGLCFARTALWWFGASELGQPSVTLIVAAMASVLFLAGVMLRKVRG